MAWVKSYHLENPSTQAIMTKRELPATATAVTVHFWIRKEKVCLGTLLRNDSGKLAYEAEDTVLQENTWHHVALVKDDIQVHFYVDGALQESAEHERTGEFNITEPLYVGVHHFSGTWNCPFDGIIDEVAVFRSALSEDEIRRYMGGIVAAVHPLKKLTKTWGEIKE